MQWFFMLPSMAPWLCHLSHEHHPHPTPAQPWDVAMHLLSHTFLFTWQDSVPSHQEHCLGTIPHHQLTHTPSVPHSPPLLVSLSPFTASPQHSIPCLPLALTALFPLHLCPRHCMRSVPPLSSSCLSTSVSFRLAGACVPGGKTVFWFIHIISKVHPDLNSPVSSWEMKQ